MPRKTKDVDVKQATSKVQKSNKEEIKSKKVEEVKKSTKKTAEKKAPLKKDTDKKNTAKKDSTTKKIAVKKDTTTKKSTTKKVSEKKDNITKKETVKKDTATKKSTAKKAELSAVSNSAPKKSKETNLSSKAKKDLKRETVKAKKSTEVSKSDKKTNSTKSTKTAKPKQSTATSSKKTSKQTKTVSSKKASKQSNTVFSPEYYDLPFKYNQTVVKILAQTPTNLFIYWEISDEDRENLKNQYGQYFFEITKPVLIVHNTTFNYSFEVDIDDFANSWYLHVNDSNSEYKVELGRRPIPVNYNYISNYDIEKNGPISELQTPYVYISSSNELDTPNDKILFNKISKLYFRNVKTNDIVEKDISDFSSIYKDGIFINIYKLYQELYKEEIKNDSFNLYNPSSGNISSGSFSSRFY